MRFFRWLKNLFSSQPRFERPKPPRHPIVIALHNGRKASVDARGNFLGFVD